MNTKRLAIFGSSAVVLAGILVYALGIYPPASGRDGRGAIGQRNVYRADQPADASVNPGDAPVATANQLKSGDVVTLQNGQMFQLSNGITYQVLNGKIAPLQDGAIYRLADGQMVQMKSGNLYAQMDGKFTERLKSDNFVAHLKLDQLAALNGFVFKLNQSQLQKLDMNSARMQSEMQTR